MTAPWLSVVMPVHAGGKWLAETLASVAREDTSGIEIILFDSSEDDACQQIAATFSHSLTLRYERRIDIKPWTTKTNLAVDSARASHVAMLHQDDLWLPGRAATLRRAIDAAPEATLLLFPSKIVDPASRPLGTWRCPLPTGRNSPLEVIAERLLVQNFVALPAPVIRRDAWLATGGMDESLWYTADWDLYLKLARQGPVCYEPIASTAFRIHPDSLTVSGSRNRADFIAQMACVINRHIDLVRPERRERVLRCAWASVRVNDSLAAAARGERGALVEAVGALLRLSPADMRRYWRDSRLSERVWPRMRARFAGSF
jgi:glycosyltransferase involved in cell wall biosynthesis